MLTMQSLKGFVMKHGRPGVAIVSCNDGLRPVIMKLEATEEEAKIDYTPIER